MALPPRDLNLILCQALNLDPKRVAGFVITCKPQEAPTVEIINYLDDRDAGRLATALKRCDLVPKP